MLIIILHAVMGWPFCNSMLKKANEIKATFFVEDEKHVHKLE